MLNRRLWTHLKELLYPPFASTSLMMLLCVIWLMGIEESLALAPHLLVSPLQAYRLLTYCLCPPDAPLFGFSLLLFPLLGWPLERQQGTLRYLHASALGAAASALLYLLLSGLWGARLGAAVSGYTPVHLALLGCRQRQKDSWRWTSAAALAGLLVAFSQVLSPDAPFLLHLSGLLAGLAFRFGLFSPLELSDRQLEKLHNGILCRTLRARGLFLQFIMPPASTVLPVTRVATRRESHQLPFPVLPAQTFFPTNAASHPLCPVSPPTSDSSGESPGLGWESRWSLASDPPPGFSAAPFPGLRASLMDEELLQAGIQASLQDMARDEVSLSKSSVSSLRLQQLQKMGFPTEEAVVALAATGHVEGAVSLLIGGHVGDKTVVTGESRSAHRQWPLSGTQQ